MPQTAVSRIQPSRLTMQWRSTPSVLRLLTDRHGRGPCPVPIPSSISLRTPGPPTMIREAPEELRSV